MKEKNPTRIFCGYILTVTCMYYIIPFNFLAISLISLINLAISLLSLPLGGPASLSYLYTSSECGSPPAFMSSSCMCPKEFNQNYVLKHGLGLLFVDVIIRKFQLHLSFNTFLMSIQNLLAVYYFLICCPLEVSIILNALGISTASVMWI